MSEDMTEVEQMTDTSMTTAMVAVCEAATAWVEADQAYDLSLDEQKQNETVNFEAMIDPLVRYTAAGRALTKAVNRLRRANGGDK